MSDRIIENWKLKVDNGLGEWKEYRLGNLGTVVTGKTPSKKHPEDWGNVMPFITPSDYKNYKKKANNSDRKLSENGIKKLRNKVLPKNSILVTCIGSDMGKVIMNAVESITNQQINSIIPNTKIVSRDFLYYKLIAMYEILRIYGGDGTAVPIINKSDFENLDIKLPPLPEQKAIAEVLSSLDDKIDLLHRQNKTLEQMAETLFRQWFLPVRGTQTGVEEAKEDWEYTELRNFVKIYNGVSYKSEDLKASDKALVTLKNFNRDGSLRLDGFKEYTGKYKNQHIVIKDDLVVAHTDITQNADIIGNPLMIIDIPKYSELIISMDMVKVEPKFEWLSKEFLYYLMKTRLFKEHCVGYSNGSTVLHLSKEAIPSFEFFLPPKKSITDFTKQVVEIISKKNNNINQIRTLEKMRDTLLPKLMSGEVKVKVKMQENKQCL